MIHNAQLSFAHNFQQIAHKENGTTTRGTEILQR
jgi:hypothetical protein